MRSHRLLVRCCHLGMFVPALVINVAPRRGGENGVTAIKTFPPGADA